MSLSRLKRNLKKLRSNISKIKAPLSLAASFIPGGAFVNAALSKIDKVASYMPGTAPMNTKPTPAAQAAGQQIAQTQPVASLAQQAPNPTSTQAILSWLSKGLTAPGAGTANTVLQALQTQAARQQPVGSAFGASVGQGIRAGRALPWGSKPKPQAPSMVHRNMPIARVSSVPALKNGVAVGRIDYSTFPFTIEIATNHPRGRQLVALVHEIVHAIVRLRKLEVGQSHEGMENAVHNLALGILNDVIPALAKVGYLEVKG